MGADEIPKRWSGPSEDLIAIAALHERDEAAAQNHDGDTLQTLWTDDIVVLPPKGEPVIGREANLVALREQIEQLKETEITEYRLDFEEVQVLGDRAFEWGRYRGVSRPTGGGDEEDEDEDEEDDEPSGEEEDEDDLAGMGSRSRARR